MPAIDIALICFAGLLGLTGVTLDLLGRRKRA